MPSPPHHPNPGYQHGRPTSVGVLLCNLGTPDEPTASAVRRYLAEFLSDPRVVEIPRAVWLPLLYGVILPRRAGASAAKYASIWRPDGSPLRVWTERQASGLHRLLQDQGLSVQVDYAMRYGQPSIAARLDALVAAGATRVLVLSAYPQYSGTTTASVIDAVNAWSARQRNIPELRFVNHYHDDAGYIEALAASVQRQWAAQGRSEHLVMSFHGVPERTLHLGDPYHCECRKTGRLLAERLGLAPEAWTLTFQSRFGRAKWLEPYTEPTLRALAARGVATVDVVCPGFTSDCLETLEEIAQEGRHAFIESGGKALNYVPCLNDDAGWIAALAAIARQHLGGWPVQAVDDAGERAASQQRAIALGAPA